nr:PREDICTED: Fc receptor-like protein 3 isoform X2 [Lepisosteus oculatus]
MHFSKAIMLIILVDCTSWLLDVGAINREPIVMSYPPDGGIFEGDMVTLECKVDGDSKIWSYFWFKDSKQDESHINHSQYRISSVSISDSGDYSCYIVMTSDPVEQHSSKPFTLQVLERPRAVISLGQEWSEVHAGETAVLRCSISGSYPMQSFGWYKDEHTSPVHQSEDKNWTILSALESHTGHYSCQGRSRENPSYSKKSSPVKLKVQVTRPRTVLSLQRLHTEVFEGDTITLSCVVEDSSPGWSFYWYKDILDKPEHKSQSSSYIVSPANLSHTGQYWCQAARGQKPFYLNPSQPISLIVLELTDPALSVQPGSLVTEGDSVALHCHTALSDKAHERLHFSYVKEGGDWKSESSEKTLTIPVIRRNHTGQYWCEVEAVGTGIRKRSNETGITVRELFHRISLTVLPLGPVWEGETLTLHCTVQLNTPAHTPELQYTYIKDGRVLRSRPEDRHSVPAVRLKDSGKYLCGVEAQGKGIQAMSSVVEVNVTERPKPRVTQEPAWEKLYYGEPVTLRCLLSQHFHSVEYLWFRGDLRSPVFHTTEHSVNGNSLQISSVVLSDQGQYLCLVHRGRPTQYSQPSDPFLLNVSVDPSKATLRLHPDWTVLFPAESVTMGCRLGGDSSRRQYSWYRVTAGGTESVQCQWENGKNCQVTFRDESHSGLYWCEAQSGQERSKSVHFRVLDRRLVLQTAPQPLTEGQTLTLQCRVRNESSQQIVGYMFYKDNETLKHTGNITTIGPVKKRDKGLYRCRVTYTGGSGDKSQPVLISIRGEPAMDWHFCLAFVVCWVGSGFPQHRMVKSSLANDMTQLYLSTFCRECFPPVVVKANPAHHSSRGRCGALLTQPVSCVLLPDLFSQVTLRASPGARVQEGEPLNLTCEAELTGYYSSPLSYSFFRDGQPVVEGSSSALYSMAKVNRTLTGSYSCAVEAEHRIRKNSTITAVTLAGQCGHGVLGAEPHTDDQSRSMWAWNH